MNQQEDSEVKVERITENVFQLNIRHFQTVLTHELFIVFSFYFVALSLFTKMLFWYFKIG